MSAYATIADMIRRYGEVEMRRVSVVDGDVPDTVLPARIEAALAEACSVADTYLAARYAIPITPAPLALTRAVCQIARLDLQTGGDRTPSEDARKDADAARAWLKAVSDGQADLEGVAVKGGAALGDAARVSDRPALVSTKGGGWPI